MTSYTGFGESLNRVLNELEALNMPERTLILDGLTRDVMDSYFLFDD